MQELNKEPDRDLEAIRREAEEKFRQLQGYNKKQCDAKCKRNTVYHKGDLVAIRTVKMQCSNNKLRAKFRGPYQVKKVLDNNRYIISDLDGYQVTSTHFDGTFDPFNLRLYRKAVDCNAKEVKEDSFASSDSEPEFYGFPDDQ